jgi:predicted nucleic acid-binding protein
VNGVLADANVLISAALARSPNAPSARILEAAIDGRVSLITSPTLLAEIVSVLRRPRLRRYLSIGEAERYVADLASTAIVTGDLDLLELADPAVRILTPRDFVTEHLDR